MFDQVSLTGARSALEVLGLQKTAAKAPPKPFYKDRRYAFSARNPDQFSVRLQGAIDPRLDALHQKLVAHEMGTKPLSAKQLANLEKQFLETRAGAEHMQGRLFQHNAGRYGPGFTPGAAVPDVARLRVDSAGNLVDSRSFRDPTTWVKSDVKVRPDLYKADVFDRLSGRLNAAKGGGAAAGAAAAGAAAAPAAAAPGFLAKMGPRALGAAGLLGAGALAYKLMQPAAQPQQPYPDIYGRM